MGVQGLKAGERIRRRREFERVYTTGQRKHGRFMTLFQLSNGLPTSRLGVAATRKLGGAVERNRAKRLAREIFRRHKPAGNHDVVIVPRREMLDAPFSHLEADFYDLLERPGRPDLSSRRPSSNRRPGRHSRI